MTTAKPPDDFDDLAFAVAFALLCVCAIICYFIFTF